MLKQNFLLLFLFFSLVRLSAQAVDSAKYYIDEGLKWHDAGNYDKAIEAYDNSIRIKPGFVAGYEKGYSLFLAKRYDECIALSQQMLKEYKGNPELKNIYVNYGSALDEKGKPGEALDVYDDGMKDFPGFYLLPYNKGLTLFKMGRDAEAETMAQKALQANPLHPSSNNMLGIILKKKNKVPALLADVTFLLTETQGPRAEESLKRLEDIFTSNISRSENGATTITINSDLLDRKKGGENNFSMTEFSMTLLSGLDKDSLYKNESPPERLQRKLDLVIGSLGESKKNKGFYWSHYAPFFSEMKEKNFTDVVSNLCYFSTGEEPVKKWLEVNDAKVKSFYDWFGKYHWNN